MLRDTIWVICLTISSFLWIEFFSGVLFGLLMWVLISFSIKKFRNERSERKMNIRPNT